MARTKTTHDVFSAIGEPKRRPIIEALVVHPMTVGELVEAMHWPQPVVSKHLKVLKAVELVVEQKAGRHRIYRVRPEELRPLQEWIHQFEQYWGGAMDQLDAYIDRLQNLSQPKDGDERE